MMILKNKTIYQTRLRRVDEGATDHEAGGTWKGPFRWGVRKSGACRSHTLTCRCGAQFLSAVMEALSRELPREVALDAIWRVEVVPLSLLQHVGFALVSRHLTRTTTVFASLVCTPGDWELAQMTIPKIAEIYEGTHTIISTKIRGIALRTTPISMDPSKFHLDINLSLNLRR